MKITADIQLRFEHQLHFTQDALDPANPVIADCLPTDAGPTRLLPFVDTHVAAAFSDLPRRLRQYADAHPDRLQLAGRVQPVVGGEACKNDRDAIYRILNAIHEAGLDRQSGILVIGGGAVLDCVGFAAAIAHRGIRLLRMPTTTLAQADSGVGVKNGINGFGQKNFLGTFAVPWVVINDQRFLQGLPDREWRCGFVEAVKVALVRDADFFRAIEAAAADITARNLDAAAPILQQSARLHLDHIAHGGDPFELTSARPLDFGHWAAHRLECLTGFDLRHGEAVAIGIALDATYSHRVGLLPAADLHRILDCLRCLHLPLWHEDMRRGDELLTGLDEFRQHLGGRLTVTLLRRIGQPHDVHHIDHDTMRAAIHDLAPLAADAPAG